MHIVLAALVFFGILTLWAPEFWPVAVFEIGVCALAGAAVLRRRHEPFIWAWPFVPLSFAVVWGLLQLLTRRTVYAFDTRNAIVKWTVFLAVFYLGLSMFRSRAVAGWFRSAMLWFAFVVSILSTLQAFTSRGRVFWIFSTPPIDFMMGPFPSRNHYAAFIEAVLPIALYQALHRGRDSLLYSIMAAAMFASVIASASRAGVILAAAEVIAVPAILWFRGRASGAAVGFSFLPMAVAVAVFIAIVSPEAAWTRFRQPDPYAIRRELAVSSLHMIATHPWFGTGLGTWPTAYPRYAIADFGAFVNQAHCDWLEWGAEGGVPFAVMLATMLFWSVRPALRSVWGLGILSVLLHATVDYPFARPALGAWPILVLALLAATQSDTPKRTRPNHSAPKIASS